MFYKFICLSGILLCGCSSFQFSESEKPLVSNVGNSLSDQKLERIYQHQLRIISQIEEEFLENTVDEPTLRFKMEGVVREYDSFLADNPESVEGWILYGKLMRRIGERLKAQNAFMKADAIDPNIAVVKQQLGNFYAEELQYDLALAMYAEAIDLAPDEAAYSYGLGHLLFTFKKEFVESGAISENELDAEMMHAFLTATQKDPANKDFAFRYAEAFYDLTTPNWSEALKQWEALLTRADEGIEKQSVYLHLARVHTEMGEFSQAKAFLDKVDLPVLEASKETVVEMINAQYPSE